MADLEHYLATLGPVAILVGAGVEGLSAAVAGGVAARQGLIAPAVAVAAAALGSAIMVQVLFLLGRGCRDIGLVRRVKATPAFDKALGLIERHPSAFVLSFRFLIGLRAAGPVAVGVSRVGPVRFAILNAIGAVIWAVAAVSLGYAFGPAVLAVLKRAMAHAGPVAAGLAMVALAAGLIVWRWRVWKAKRA